MTNGTHTLRKTLAAGSAALIVAGAGAGTAAACHGQQQSSTSATSFTFRHGGFQHAGGFWAGRSNVVASAVVLYLNLPASTIKTDLTNGQSLAQIATAEGKDPNGLVAAIVAAVKPQLDAAVVNGKISSTQESTILTDLTTKVTNWVDNQFTPQQQQQTVRHGFDHHRR